MNLKERFANAVLGKETDRLPHSDIMIHDKLIAAITHEELPGDDGNALAKWMFEPISDANFQRHVKARKFLELGHVVVFPIETTTDAGVSEHGNPLIKDVWGGIQECTPASTVIIKDPINSVEELESYEFPDIEDFDYHNVDVWVKEGSFYVVPQIDFGYFKASELLGFERYMNFVVTEEERMHRFLKRLLEFQIKLADKLISHGVDAIELGDDVAFNNGPFMSPEFLQMYDFDYMGQIVDHIHSKGLPVILHSCGNMNAVIERIIDTKVDVLHALQPSAHNDIYEYKEKYGDKIVLMGNVDINYLMTEGSPVEIGATVDEMAEKLWYDKKGFILSTCNMLNMDQPVENVLSLHMRAQKY
ncbi:hypothetical protein AGMMS49983_06280 [Clostridia bacterium]|nr:hypothetical protein AGMMS49983_06280 [Clostridia bacterium]